MELLQDRVNSDGKKVLELGVGLYPKPGTTVGIDKCDSGKTDIVRDFAKKGIPFSECTFDEVRMYDVIEHIELWEDFVFTMNEIYRVLKPGGIFYFSTPGTYDDCFSHITHFRYITSGNMLPYFQKSDIVEYQWMRKTDGIICDFDMEFRQGADASILQGFFTKK